ncbi:MAG: hypothetical protein PQJ46_15350 [Spirochaetales bacterium]|nr:hypothetical protein [Spirochaetales bacterium]
MAVCFHTDKIGNIISVLDEGLSSQITYGLRLRSRRRPSVYFWVTQKKTIFVTYVARKDFLTGLYIIDNGKNEKTYEGSENFCKAFLSCTFEDLGDIDFNDYKVEAKVSADLIKRPAPLSLLDPFFFNEKIATAWVQYGK